jgi:CheY-like chemotaxis protein
MDRPIRLLLVEDEAFIALSMELQLRKAGFQIGSAAATGEEALERIQEELPDIVLMDIRLAGPIDGIETARRIKESEGIPLIFLSGYAHDENEDLARELDPLGFFTKPVEMHSLIRLIRESMGIDT